MYPVSLFGRFPVHGRNDLFNIPHRYGLPAGASRDVGAYCTGLQWRCPLKAGLTGPGETIPIVDGQKGLPARQNIFVCEFDGPRSVRKIVVTIFDTGK